MAWKGLKEKVVIICPYHGPFKQLPIVHLKKSGCQKCISSKGETKIRLILRSKRITFEEQFIFVDCVDKKPLPFDFLLTINGKTAVIEYHGEHHFEPVGFGNKNHNDVIEQFNNVKRHDEIKKEWCFKNKIPFLGIPFFDNDKIEFLISDFINKLLG